MIIKKLVKYSIPISLFLSGVCWLFWKCKSSEDIIQEFNSKKSPTLLIVLSLWTYAVISLTDLIRCPEYVFLLDRVVVKSPNDKVTTFMNGIRGEFYGGRGIRKNKNNTKAIMNWMNTTFQCDPNIDCCIMTGWNVSHFLFYLVLGFISPQKWRELILVGILFEVFEACFLKCHDWSDIFYNTAGVLLGTFLRS